MSQLWVEDLGQEFEGASLGDQRRSTRLVRIAQAIAKDPSAGFPKALISEAELEAFYRFINNDAVDPQAILEPHLSGTRRRAAQAGEVVVVHDTTHVEFPGEGTREGLGYTTALGRQGFQAHVSLCLSASTGVPLGVAHLETYTRTGKTWSQRRAGRRKRRDNEPRESARWLRGVAATHSTDGVYEAIHVMDAEADFFELFQSLRASGARFVIRAGQLSRRITADGDAMALRDAIEDLTPRVWREIHLAQRKRDVKKQGSNGRKKNPPRSERAATVGVASTTIGVAKTKYSNAQKEAFGLTVVRVWEPEPPAGEPPVDWVLLTGEPVRTKRDLERVVDLYRLRWTIEDYFKALKSGCSLERRQMESYDALCRVLALLAPIACRLLHLRGLAKASPDAPATEAFTPVELKLMHNAPAAGRRPMPTTVGEALLLLARLGGHIRNNGDPGWLTLSRGYHELMLLRIGWQLARGHGKCDQ